MQVNLKRKNYGFQLKRGLINFFASSVKNTYLQKSFNNHKMSYLTKLNHQKISQFNLKSNT